MTLDEINELIRRARSNLRSLRLMRRDLLRQCRTVRLNGGPPRIRQSYRTRLTRLPIEMRVTYFSLLRKGVDRHEALKAAFIEQPKEPPHAETQA